LNFFNRILGQKESNTSSDLIKYVKSIPMRYVSDVDKIKFEVQSGNIVVCNISPLAKNSIEDVIKCVNDLTDFIQKNEGDIARLGEERIVLTPKNIRIWRATEP